MGAEAEKCGMKGDLGGSAQSPGWQPGKGICSESEKKHDNEDKGKKKPEDRPDCKTPMDFGRKLHFPSDLVGAKRGPRGSLVRGF